MAEAAWVIGSLEPSVTMYLHPVQTEPGIAGEFVDIDFHCTVDRAQQQRSVWLESPQASAECLDLKLVLGPCFAVKAA